VASYCGELKVLADKLRDLGSPVPDHDLIVGLLSGLNDKFAHCVSTISASRPPMTFHQAQSFLLQEETYITNRAKKAASTTLLAIVRSAGVSTNAPVTGSSAASPANPTTGSSDRSRKRKKQAGRTAGPTGGHSAGQTAAAAPNSFR